MGGQAKVYTPTLCLLSPIMHKPINIKKPTGLAPNLQAGLFLQLAHLEQAGLPAAQAFATIAKNDPLLQKHLKTLPTRLNGGQKIAEAGFKAGIFDGNQCLLIAAAENSGRLAEVYKKLADYYGSGAKRQKKMLSRLYLPAFTLILAFFIQPLPALITAKITLGQYLYESAGQLLIMAIGIALLVKFPGFLVTLGQAALLHKWQLVLSPIANWVRDRQLNRFYFLLAMMLDAGLAYSEALPQAVASIGNSALREQFAPALNLMKTGASVTETLATVSAVKPTTRQILATGEYSGRLADTLLHFAQIDAETLALQDDSYAEWLPRLIYTAIGLWMAYSILAGGAPTTAPI